VSVFGDYLAAVIHRAQLEASDAGSAKVEAPHLLLAIAAQTEPSIDPLLEEFGLDVAAVRAALDREYEHSLNTVGVTTAAYDLPRPTRLPTRPGIGRSAKLAMERGFGAVTKKKGLRPAHLLLGVVCAEVGTVPRALALAGVDREAVLARLRQAIDTPTM
jgi:D-alanyl-D-alanine carboxypeptidase